MLGSISFEIRMLNAIKKRTYFVSLAPLLPSRTQVRFFTLVLNSGSSVNENESEADKGEPLATNRRHVSTQVIQWHEQKYES